MSRFDVRDPAEDREYCDGLEPSTDCPICHGTGDVERPDDTGAIVWADCLACEGTGEQR